MHKFTAQTIRKKKTEQTDFFKQTYDTFLSWEIFGDQPKLAASRRCGLIQTV